MGNLSNLYISQSFQSLAHLGTNNALVPGTMTQLEDGIGQSLNISFDGTNISSSGNIFAANLTGSASTGSFMLTGSVSVNVLTFTKADGSTFDLTVAASGSVVPGTISGSAQITALGFVSSSVTASSLITASFDNGTRNLTFTKGNNTTFNVNIPDVSGSTINTGSFVTTSSFNAYTSSTNNRLNNLESTSASVNVSISNLNSTTASQATSITNINSATASLFTSTSLSLTTASFDNGTRNLTFTKGNTTQFSVNIPDASGSAPTTIYDTVYTGESITKGDPLYISGSQGANPIVFKADAAVPAKMPVTYVSNQTIGAGTTTEAIILGHIEGIDLTGYTAGQSIYVAEGGGFSTSLPSGSNSITQLLGVITKGGSGGKGLVLNPGPAQLPGLDTGKMWVGNGNNQPIEITSASFVSSASFNSYTSSTNSRLTNIESTTASLLIETQNLELFSASALISISNLNASSASQQISINNLNTATSSLFTSASLSLTTASVSGQTMTFTKGDGTTFNVTLPAGGSGSIDTASFATTGSNTFVGNQTISQSKSIILGNSGSINTISNGSIEFQSTAGLSIVNTTSGELDISQYGVSTARFFHRGGGALEISGSSTYISDVNFIPFSASLNSRILAITGSSINTGSFATTGSNTFTGDQTLIDNAGNFFTISDASGSMMLVAKGFTSASAHISASSAGIGNFIFKTNSNTATTTLSGSNNIFTNTGNPTAGFRRYLTSGNISMMGALPQISASMAFSPTISNNSFLNVQATGNPLTIRGPISSSTYTINSNQIFNQVNLGSSAANNAEKIVAGISLNSNIIQTLSIVANRTNTTQNVSISNNQLQGTTTLNMNSSSIDLSNNLWAGTNTITNNSSGSSRVSAAGNAVGLYQNILLGTNTITFSGSNDVNDTQDLDYQGGMYRSMIIGTNTPFVQTGPTGSNSITNTAIIGNGLIVTGSSGNPVTGNDSLRHGSVFVGRFNDVSGNKDLTAETIFAVGTGTATAAASRKTGFLIDSGSNTFVEGTLNVSGATSLNGNLVITGSLTASLQQGFLYVGNASGITTTVATSSFISTINTGSFATTGSNTFDGNQTITGSVNITGSLTTAGNMFQVTGSFNTFGNVITQLGVFTSSLAGGLEIDGIGYVGSGSAGAFFINSTTQDIKIQNYYSSSVNGKNIVIENFSQTGSGGIHGKVVLRARGTGGAVTVENSSQFRVECQTEITGSLIVSGSLSAANDFKLGRGTDKPTDKVTVGSGGLIVSNSLVTSNSYIFATNDTTVGNYSPVVSNITAGSFGLSNGGYGGNIDVMYMIVNPY